MELELERMNPEISIREPGADEVITTDTIHYPDMWHRWIRRIRMLEDDGPDPEISIREPGADEATTTGEDIVRMCQRPISGIRRIPMLEDDGPGIRRIPMLEDDGPVMRRSGRTRAANRSGYFRDVQEQNTVPCYKTNAKAQGICVIINNRDFYKDPVKPEAKELKKRNGTDKDALRLIDTFGNLGFKINYKENLSDTDMVNAVNQLADLDHSNYNCFVCCILSHGTEGAIYGSNGCLLDVKNFTAPFRAQSCPSLSGKPKLFFMQASQGQEKQPGCKTQIDSGIDMEAPQAEMIPNEADFFLGYATVPGFVSYRSTSDGSWYITKLTEILNKYAKKEDIHSLLLLVNHEVGKENANMEDGTYKQSPALFSSLRKKLIFR